MDDENNTNSCQDLLTNKEFDSGAMEVTDILELLMC